jgi:S-adenosylmethionine/arginine decarboxylase-like enzyme
MIYAAKTCEGISLPLGHSFIPLEDLSKLEGRNFEPDTRYRGFHVLLDYSGFPRESPKELSDWTMSNILSALKKNNIRCVHSHSEIFDEVPDAESPPGFTSVCLLDESHVSAHCYSDKGMLAINVFTCGGKPNQTYAAAQDIHEAVLTRLPDCKFLGSSTFRFPYKIG